MANRKSSPFREAPVNCLWAHQDLWESGSWKCKCLSMMLYIWRKPGAKYPYSGMGFSVLPLWGMMTAEGWKEYDDTCLEKDGDVKSNSTPLPVLSRGLFRVGLAFKGCGTNSCLTF